MLIQQLNRTDAERVQIAIKNVDGGGSITTGLGVAFPISGASIDGINVVRSTAALQRGFVGVATMDVAINGYGLATCWGYVNSVQISNVGSSITVTAGDVLKPGAVAGTFFSSLANEAYSTLMYRFVYAAATVPATISAQDVAFVPGIVRAL